MQGATDGSSPLCRLREPRLHHRGNSLIGDWCEHGAQEPNSRSLHGELEAFRVPRQRPGLYMKWAKDDNGKLEASWHLDNDHPSVAPMCAMPAPRALGAIMHQAEHNDQPA